MNRRPLAWRLTGLATAACLLSGCGVLAGGLRGVDLPGGADLGDEPYTVTVEFADVVDLVPQSLVKVDDVAVGTVSDIRVGPNWTALVTLVVNRDVAVPADAHARVRTTSLLGEKFVELDAPTRARQDGGTGTSSATPGRLVGGATIPLARTGRAAEVEEVLGALSMLLNGGGVAQIRTIATELNAALAGNEQEVRALLGDVDQLVGALDDRKTEIIRALDAINRLGSTLNERRGQIETVLDGLGPGLAELESQRGRLVDMLQAVDRLSGVATSVVNRSRDDVLADLDLLRPTLAKLVESGADLPNSLQVFFTPPFTDAAADAFAGDYANLYVRAELDLGGVLSNLARSNQPFPGPDGPLSGLPPTSQLLGPLLGPTAAQPPFPLVGGVPELPVPVPGAAPATPGRGSPAPAAPEGAPGGLLGSLLGGGR